MSQIYNFVFLHKAYIKNRTNDKWITYLFLLLIINDGLIFTNKIKAHQTKEQVNVNKMGKRLIKIELCKILMLITEA